MTVKELQDWLGQFPAEYQIRTSLNPGDQVVDIFPAEFGAILVDEPDNTDFDEPFLVLNVYVMEEHLP